LDKHLAVLRDTPCGIGAEITGKTLDEHFIDGRTDGIRPFKRIRRSLSFTSICLLPGPINALPAANSR
jgi:hypothetical protein